MEQRDRDGKIGVLLSQTIGSGYGPPSDFLDAEAIVRLENSSEAFAMRLRAGDPNLSANLAMLSLLRDAEVHKYTIHLVGWFEPGKLGGWLARVVITGPQPTPLEPEALVYHEPELVGTH